jgi:hypothetical protein
MFNVLGQINPQYNTMNQEDFGLTILNVVRVSFQFKSFAFLLISPGMTLQL